MSSMADHLDQPDHLEPEPATLPPVDAGTSVEVRRAAMITAYVGITHAVLLVLAGIALSHSCCFHLPSLFSLSHTRICFSSKRARERERRWKQ